MSKARFARIALLCALAFVAAPNSAWAQRAANIADSLTDREFWRIFTTMSESGGEFPSENFVSNEKTYQYVIPTLQRTLTPNGVYLGVGPEQNFAYVANLKPKMAVIFDIRRQNAMLHLMYKALFELSPTRATFVSRLFSRTPAKTLASTATPAEIFDAIATVTPNDSLFTATWKAIVDRLAVTHGFALSADDVASMRKVFEAFREAGPDISYAYRLGAPPPSVTLWHVTYAQLQSMTNVDSLNMGFLADEERYLWLRAFERRNLVVPIVGDFAGTKAIRAVGDYLKEHHAVATAFYTSNVEQYLLNNFGADQRFYKNVEALPIDSTSVFIRSVPGGPGPTVRTLLATTIDSAGKAVTVTIPPQPATTANTSAFISGTASLARTLEAFLGGQLKSYQQIMAMTKTEGWSQRP